MDDRIEMLLKYCEKHKDKYIEYWDKEEGEGAGIESYNALCDFIEGGIIRSKDDLAEYGMIE